MRRSVTRLSLLVTGLLVAAASVATSQALSAQNAGSLPQDLDTILASPELAGADVGLVVRVANTGEVLYRRDGDRRKQPASNAKLLTVPADYDALAAQIATSGIRTVSGELVADGTWFDDVPYGPYGSLSDKNGPHVH